VGETRVDLQHLLEDLRDAYTGALEETILTEVIANALDSGATLIRLVTSPAEAALTIVDDGRGMKRKELSRYHDIAASTKKRGEGIGFAGVGIKLGLLASREVITETRRGATHVATRWHLASRHRAPWKWIPPPGLTTSRGTAVRLTLANQLSPLLDAGYLEETIRQHFEPLLDAAFDQLLRKHYPDGVRFEIDGRRPARPDVTGAERVPIAITLGRRRTPSVIGFIERNSPGPTDREGVAISTFGKVIKRGWDWLGLIPAPHAHITGLIEAPDLAACLTLSKNDFIRSGARGASYLAYRKAIQEVVSRQLAQWGDERSAEPRPRIARLERDLERVLEDLADDFPLLRSLVDRRAGGQKRLPMPGRGHERVPPPLFANLAIGRESAAEATVSSPAENGAAEPLAGSPLSSPPSPGRSPSEQPPAGGEPQPEREAAPHQDARPDQRIAASSSHEPGFMSVDIVTRPGLDGWRGSTNTGFRDAAFNARNAFAPVKGDERHHRFGISLSGPLWKQHTSLALTVDGVDAFDTKTIVAARPSGYFADSIRKPNDTLNASGRVEHMLTKSQMLRAELQRNHSFAENLGVGDFDLIDRAYTQTRTENLLRASLTGGLRKTFFNELRLQWRGDETRFDAASPAPAVLVLNAFNSGGAQVAGTRRAYEFQVADDLDMTAGHHAIRTGVQLDIGRYSSDVVRNGGGTFTFSSLAAYAAGAPTTFTRNVGNPAVSLSQTEAALYLEDDMRVRQNLTVSGGLRQEVQSHIGGLHLGPRGGITWSPFKSGKTTVRAGAGIFFDWFDAQNYEQAVQLDGTHQQIQTIVQPGYPDPAMGGRAVALPSGRVEIASELNQPELREAMAGVEQALAGSVRVQAMYIHRSGVNLLRGVNVNAPLGNGQRPDPLSGPVTEIQSVASSEVNALSLNLNFAKPERRLFVAANYTLSRSVNDSDGTFSLPADSYDLAAERGPALNTPRHRFMSLINTPLVNRFRLGTSLRVQSALPYNITTGRDENGDTVSNDRPAGVTRNTGRGRAQVDLGARLSWSVAFGAPTAGSMQAPQIRIVRGDGADPLGAMGGMNDPNKRYGVEFFAQAYNLLNHMNATSFSGVLTSPFFGQPTSAAPPRRVEVGARVSF
jgi:hypothetical protein